MRRTNIKDVFAEAVQLHRVGRWASAAAAYRRVLLVSPKHISALLNLGQLLGRDGNLAEAAALFDRAVKADPHNAAAWERLGDALVKLRQLDKAEEALRKAVVLVPGSSLCWCSLGYVFLESNRWTESEAASREAVRLDPDRLHAWNNLGYALIAQKRWLEAEEALRRAILIDPTQREIWRNLSRALLGQNRAAEAEKVILKARSVTRPQPSEPTLHSISQQNADCLVSRCLTHEGRQLSLSVDDVRSLHAMAMHGSVKRPGAFRTGSIAMLGGIIFPPSWKEIPALMSECCMYLNTEWFSSDLFHLGAYALWRISAIHPFEDGNGRIARSLCLGLMRAKDARMRACDRSSDILVKDRMKYIARLSEADQLFEQTREIRLSTLPVEGWLREVFEGYC